MKLLLVILSGVISLCGATADAEGKCCPKDKETWCDIPCYTCTDEDITAMLKEQTAFNNFMDLLYEMDALNRPVAIWNCTSGQPVPTNITFVADMWQLRESMYTATYTNYQKCMDCTRNPTPVKFSKCSVKLRKANALGLKAGIKNMKEYFEKKVSKHEQICNDLIKN